MQLVLLVYQLALLLLAQARNDCMEHPTFRQPASTDIDVFCGTETVELSILLCPIYFIGYNESALALNAQYFKDKCKGTPDWTVDPPVLRFNFSITEDAISACSSELTVIEEVGTEMFADFSVVQYINISGMVCSQDRTAGIISYQKDVMYKFSCRYPLQYLVNNTEMSVTGVSLAYSDMDGSFISALNMDLYSDRSYTNVLTIPPEGLKLKTRIFVEVNASNLTNKFNVLLDRCYATPSRHPLNLKCQNLFVGCTVDCQTEIAINGGQQEARFSFETFRFVHSKDAFFSTYFIHCATRLCVKSLCPDIVQNCTTGISSRRRRAISNNQGTTVTDTATVSSGPIFTSEDNDSPMDTGGAEQHYTDSTTLVLSLLGGIFGVICLAGLAFIVYHKYKSSMSSNDTILYPQK